MNFSEIIYDKEEVFQRFNEVSEVNISNRAVINILLAVGMDIFKGKLDKERG